MGPPPQGPRRGRRRRRTALLAAGLAAGVGLNLLRPGGGPALGAVLWTDRDAGAAAGISSSQGPGPGPGRSNPRRTQAKEERPLRQEEEEEEEEDACKSAALIPTAPKRLRRRELERVKTMGAAKDGQNNELVQTTPKQPPQAPVGWQSTNNSSLSRRQPSLAAPITFSKRLKKRQSLHNAASGRGGKGTRFFNRKRKLESNRPQRRSSANGTEAAAPSASISVTFEGSYSKRLFRPTPAAANARLTQSSLEDIFSQK